MQAISDIQSTETLRPPLREFSVRQGIADTFDEQAVDVLDVRFPCLDVLVDQSLRYRKLSHCVPAMWGLLEERQEPESDDTVFLAKVGVPP